MYWFVHGKCSISRQLHERAQEGAASDLVYDRKFMNIVVKHAEILGQIEGTPLMADQ
jgi:hypothetical protein